MSFVIEKFSVQKLITASVSKGKVVGFSLIFVFLIDYLDYLIGGILHLSVFLLVPVALVTWNVGFGSGLFISVLSASYLIADYMIHPLLFPHPWIVLWETSVVIVYFGVTCLILAALKNELRTALDKSKTDPLTGLLNSRAFFESAEIERQRAIRYRHPFTLSFLDLDNFKKVNDIHGHLMGDRLLKEVSAILKREVRSSDLLGRIGGDEFVILFPETGPEAAEGLSRKIHQAVDDSIKNEMPLVTLSMGVVTYFDVPERIEDIVRDADFLMYEVKKAGKDNVRCLTVGVPKKNFQEIDVEDRR